MSPFRANHIDKVCRLNRDNINTKHGWILVDGDRVSIARQTTGARASAIVSLPRAEFARLARWFFTEQKLKESADNG